MQWLLAHEAQVRLAAFITVLLVLLLAEASWPRRGRTERRRRWPVNLGIVALDTLLVRLVAPLGALGAAYWAEGQGWGLLPRLSLPEPLAVVLSFLVLDLLIYGQHRLFHAWHPLWRLHRMHHSDTVIDATTGLRFHPLEILLSLLIKLLAIVALGAPPLAVLLFEVVLNATSIFNHADLRLPVAVDRALRWIVVTPDMHRVHHSWHQDETDSNFGFNLPWWDRLFGSYRDQPREGHEGMTLGLRQFRAAGEQRLQALLLQPFRA